ncbi:MAG: hypothetical protein HOP18_07775 [Deltaproteobacteria bacterium]|nr:hypothetical protein [Deltaproteobacteria bacterium]
MPRNLLARQPKSLRFVRDTIGTLDPTNFHHYFHFHHLLKITNLMKLLQLEQQAEKALVTCLADIPFLQVRPSKRVSIKKGPRPDVLTTVKLPDREQTLVAEVKSSGQPRLAREAVNQLLRYRESLPDAYGIFIAPYISPQAAAICTQEGVGYLDLVGNCYLSFGQVFIEREGHRNLFARKRDLRSLYSPKAARVLRVLLTDPRRPWKVQALADEAQVSLGQVANVKKLLADREWLRPQPDGLRLSNPGAVLAEWSAEYTYRHNQIRDYYSLRSLEEIEAELGAVCREEGIPYALTGFSGAARLAPAVRYQRVMAYVQNDTEAVTSRLQLKAVTSGANVSLLTPYDEGVFYATRDYEGIRVVSPIQLYLDLHGFRGRGEEAAKVLLDEVITPQWQ